MLHINFRLFLDPCVATEAKVVRDVLLANRVNNVKSISILYVLRVFFRNHHRLYRQLSYLRAYRGQVQKGVRI